MKYIVSVKFPYLKNLVYIGGKTPGNSEDIKLYAQTEGEAYRFNRPKEAKFFARLAPGVRKVIEVEW